MQACIFTSDPAVIMLGIWPCLTCSSAHTSVSIRSGARRRVRGAPRAAKPAGEAAAAAPAAPKEAKPAAEKKPRAPRKPKAAVEAAAPAAPAEVKPKDPTRIFVGRLQKEAEGAFELPVLFRVRAAQA
jgi:hypothetical protein